MPMSDGELIAILNSAESKVALFSGSFIGKQERLLKDYLGRPYGDEIPDKSQVISPDVQNVVESDMPSLARMFLSSAQPVKFVSNTENEAELQEVEEKNAYVNHLIRNQPWSYSVLYGWMKDAEIQSNGVVKYFVEDVEKTEEVSYQGVNEFELSVIQDSLKDTNVKKVEVVGRGDDIEGDVFDVTFRVTRIKQEFRIINVPTEDFLLTRNSKDLDSAPLVGDRVEKTRGQLVSEGFPKDLINKLPTMNADRNEKTTLENIRNRDQGGTSANEISVDDWASQMVEIRDLYVLVDYDEDGVQERRHIMKSGSTILINEPFDHVPYASLSSVIMPHKAIGRSRAEMTQQTQRTKTVILRQTLDNIYMVNNARHVVSSDVNIDDLLTVRPGGIVRQKKGAMLPPQQAVVPLVTEYIGDRSLQIIQYLDQVRAQSTGTLLASQGLDADAINQETATRFAGVQDEGKGKIELVARGFGETGWRKLYEGVAWMASQFQDSETEIKVLGKPLTVNPANWRSEHHIVSKVGLGAGPGDERPEVMQSIYAIQQQLKATGSLLTDETKIYNALADLTQSVGIADPGEYFNNPERPEDLVNAENEILKLQLQQATQMVEQLQSQDILSKAELIKAESKTQTDNKKAALDIAKLQEDARQFDISTAEDRRESNQKAAVELTKIEVASNKDVPGSLI